MLKILSGIKERSNKDLFKFEDISKLSYILVIIVVAFIPIIMYPKRVYTWLYPGSWADIYEFHKLFALTIVSLFMLLLLILYKNKKRTLLIKLPLLLLLSWILISSLFAYDKLTAFFGNPTRWQGFLIYVVYAIIFTFIVNMVDVKYITRILYCAFICSGLMALYAVAQYYRCEPLQSYFDFFKIPVLDTSFVRSTIGNRNFVGSYFVLLTLAAVFFFLYNKNKKMNIVLFTFSSVFYAALIASITRVAWIGAFAGLVLNLFLHRKEFKLYYKKLILIAIMFTAISLVMTVTGNGQITQKYQATVDELKIKSTQDIGKLGTFRFFVYKKSFEIFLQHPIVGTGPDNLAFYYKMTPEDIKEIPDLKNVYYDKVHSEYLEYLVTMGVPAFVFYLWFVFSIFIPWIKKCRSASPEMKGVFAGWTGYLAQATFNIGVTSVLPTFFVFTALLEKFIAHEKQIEENRTNKE